MFLKLSLNHQWPGSRKMMQATGLLVGASVFEAACGVLLFWLYIGQNWSSMRVLEALVPASGAGLIIMGGLTLLLAVIAFVLTIVGEIVSIVRRLLQAFG